MRKWRTGIPWTPVLNYNSQIWDTTRSCSHPKEMEEKNWLFMRSDLSLPIRLILDCLDREEVYFLTVIFWRWEFSISQYDIGKINVFSQKKWSSQRLGNVSLESNDVLTRDVTLWRCICVQEWSLFIHEDQLISRFERQWIDTDFNNQNL